MARGRRNKPEIDICRVQTARLRELTVPQLQRAQRRVGRLYQIPKKDQTERKPRWLLSRFLGDLVGARTQAQPRDREGYRREAERTEQLIWNMQAKRGCAIRPGELVARDAIRQGNVSPEVIDRLRGKRRPKIR